MSTTLECPFPSPTADHDGNGDEWTQVSVASDYLYRAGPPRRPAGVATDNRSPKKRYASWATGPFAPAIGAVSGAVAAWSFLVAGSASGFVMAVIVTVMFGGLAVLNALTPDFSDRS
jgi:hypothetical protein